LKKKRELDSKDLHADRINILNWQIARLQRKVVEAQKTIEMMEQND